MRYLIGLLSLLTVCAHLQAADLKTLDGQVKKGELVAVSDKSITLRSDGKEETWPTEQTLDVDVLPPAKPLPPAPYLIVRLIDGTTLKCLGFGIKGNQAEARLFNGLALTIPLHAIHYVICEAQNEAHRAEFEQTIIKKPEQDVIRLLSRDGKSINTFEGFLGDVDAKGEFVQFKMEGDVSRVSMARVRGVYYNRKLDDVPKPTCRIHDLFQNVYAASTVATAGENVELKTPTGVTMALPRGFVQRFDFSIGKLTYLSDLDPLKVEETPIFSDNYHFRRDKNLEGGPLSLSYRPYAKGLAVHSRTILEYDVKGFNVFRCVLGIDDSVKGYAHAIVRIDADDQQVFKEPVTNRDKPRDLNLKITGASKLRITVDYGDDLDLGDHVIFAEARVSK